MSNSTPNYCCLGIDLGTINSYIAGYHDSPAVVNPEVFINEGEATTPSVVSFDDTQCHVGRYANDYKVINPANTFYCIKQLIGRQCNDVRVIKDSVTLLFRFTGVKITHQNYM